MQAAIKSFSRVTDSLILNNSAYALFTDLSKCVDVICSLPFVRQFYWDIEGPCIAIDGIAQQEGERQIREALENGGIADFRYRMVEPVQYTYTPQ